MFRWVLLVAGDESFGRVAGLEGEVCADMLLISLLSFVLPCILGLAGEGWYGRSYISKSRDDCVQIWLV